MSSDPALEIAPQRYGGNAVDEIVGADDKGSEKHIANVDVDEEVGCAQDVQVDVHTHLYDGVQRNMEQRHLQMIALAGTLGTGLFLGSGKSIVHGGPLGALMAYLLIGSVGWSMLQCLGEMAVFAPISGGFLHFADRWVNPAIGFGLGWQSAFTYIIAVPSEIISASVIISYWDISFAPSHQAAYILVLGLACVLFNFLGVRYYGESEFVFAMIKICLIMGLILAGLIVDLGGNPKGERIGFRYWKDPGALAEYHFKGSLGRFLGVFTDLLQAANSFLGMEQIGIAAAEVKNPRVSVAKAAKRIIYRIFFFYFLGMLVIGMLVPYTDPGLLRSTGTAASSPFVLAFSRLGIKVLPSIINAAVLTSALSAANSNLYAGSRVLYGLALRGRAPRILARTSKNGLPYVSLVVSTCFVALAFMALSKGAATVLNWLTNLTSLADIIAWAVIAVTYLRFKAGLKAQGIDRKHFHFYNRFQPYPAYWCLFWCMVVIIFNGWEVFTKGSWDVSNFFVAYVTIPIFVICTGGYWLWKRPRWLSPMELDFVSNIPTDEELHYEEPPPKNLFVKICDYIFT